MGDLLGSFPGVRMSEDKMRRKDLCWFVGTVVGPRCAFRDNRPLPNLFGVGVLQMVSEQPYDRVLTVDN